MFKKMIKILCVVLIFIVAVIFVVYKFDSSNRTKERMLVVAEHLMDSIINEDFDKTQKYIKKADGTDLSQQELSDFLLNTSIYRVMFFTDEDPLFTYSTNVNFLNTSKGTIRFSFTALDGDLITNELNYVREGGNEYFTTDDIHKSDKEIIKFPFANDLANGEKISYDKDDYSSDDVFTYRFTQDDKGDIYLETYEDSIEDLKIAMFDMLKTKLVDKDGEYRYEWNDDCSIVSVYYDSENELSFFTYAEIVISALLCATTTQALNETLDWHLTINYYDYNTRELIDTEIIR